MGFKFNASTPIGYTKSGEAIYPSKEHVSFVNSLITRVGGGSKIGPSTPTGLTYSIEAGGVRLQCDANPAAEEVIAYVWRVGASWENSLLLVNFSSNNELIPSDQVGTYTIWVAAVDVRGLYSTPTSMEVVVTDADLGIYGPKVTLTSTGLAFANGSPSSIDITALILNLPSPSYVWTVDGVVDGAVTGGTYTVNAFTGTEKVYRCTVTSGVSGLSAYGETTIYAVTDGAAGARGSLKGYGTQYSISVSSWSDAKANRVISNMLTGATGTTDLATTTHLRIGDTVQLTNSSSYVESRFWNGSAWITAATVIEGNVLVNGEGVFTGDITGASNINISGQAVFEGSTSTSDGTAAVQANSGGASQNGIVATAGSSGYGVIGSASNGVAGVWGYSIFGPTVGVKGSGGTALLPAGSIGVHGTTPAAAAYGVVAENTGGGTALRVLGKMTIDNSTLTWNTRAIAAPTGGTTTYLRNDGAWNDPLGGKSIGNASGNVPVNNGTVNTNLNADTLDGSHASAFQPAGNYATHGTGTTYGLYGTQVAGTGVATFDGSQKPGGNSTNVWLKFIIAGVTYYVPVWS